MPGQFDYESLTPLFNPQSIAVLGASGRKDRPGYDTVVAATALGWQGRLFPVTPGYKEICGWPCVSDITQIEDPVDLAIIAGSASRIEQDLEQVIANHAKSALIYGNPKLAGDDDLPGRLAEMANRAGIPLLGPNSIGYVNYSQKSAGSWVPPEVYPAGTVAGIIQSGSFFGVSTLVDPRIRYAITIHPGQESSVSMGDMINYALKLPQTRVIALYLEIIYDPGSFIQGLENAHRAKIPVVVLKPGRSASSRSAINTHTGRMAASDDIIDAVLRKHNALRVENTDEWLTTLCLLSHVHDIGPGGLSLVGDSGGMKALIIDEAEKLGVPLTRLNSDSTRQLGARLASDLVPENPVDYWGGEEHIADHVEFCMQIIANDPGTAVAVGLGEFGAVASDEFTNRVADGIMAAAESAPVPVVAASYSSRQFNNRRIDQFSRKGMPVLDGISNMLRAFAHGFRYRDRPRINAANDNPSLHNTEEIGAALGRLRENDEHGALELLALAGMATLPALQIQTAADIEAAVSWLEKDSLWPVALKTASGHAHKSDLDGVVLGIAGADHLRQSYKALSHSLGPEALVQPMASQGPEVALGIIVDADFGPILMIASGGTLVELSSDRMFVLCPVTDDEIDILIENLACAPLFKGYRNEPALDRSALATTIRTMSTLACSVQDQIHSIDINPVVVHRDGAVAIDALVQKKE